MTVLTPLNCVKQKSIYIDLTFECHRGMSQSDRHAVTQIMIQKLHMSLIFSNLVVSNIKLYCQNMCNLYAKYVKILEICKQFSENLVNDKGNVRRPGPVPKFSDLEVVALTLAAETESFDSENWLFEHQLNDCREKMPNLISRRQFNDRRKTTSGLSAVSAGGRR